MPNTNQSKLPQQVQDYLDGKIGKEAVLGLLSAEPVEPTEGQTEHEARMQRLLEVMGPEKYNEFIHS